MKVSRFLYFIALAVLSAALWLGGPGSLTAQTPRIPQSLRSYVQPIAGQLNSIETRPIYLDGRPLFLLTAARLDDSGEGEVVSPIRERIKTVKKQIKAIAARKIPPQDLDISHELKSVGDSQQLAILRVNGQYVLTINATDAELYSTDVESQAIAVETLLKNALTRYYQERQPPYLRQRAVQSVGLVAIALAMSLLLWLIRRYGHQHRERQLKQLTQQEPEKVSFTEVSAPEEREQALAQTQLYNKIQDRKNRIKFRYDTAQKVVNLVILSLWVSVLTLLLSFFPQTRSFQVLILENVLSKALEVVLCIFGVYLLIRLSFLAIDYAFSLLQTGHLLSPHRPVRSLLRLKTLAGYLKSISVTSLTVGGVFLILSLNGIDLGPLLAGAGILGLAVSFGAQNLIRDVINGLFLIWEDQFGVGDVVTINQVAGAVETMNLRITQLRSQDGDLITIPNGQIELVKNHSNQWSRANLGIDVAYDTDINQAIAIIQQTAQALTRDPTWKEAILEPPEILGVDAFRDNSLTIRVWIKTVPLKQWDVSREFRLRLKQAFDREDIRILFPRHVYWPHFEES